MMMSVKKMLFFFYLAELNGNIITKAIDYNEVNPKRLSAIAN